MGPFPRHNAAQAQRAVSISRRQFLARCGALSAATVVARLPGVSWAGAASPSRLRNALGPTFRLLALDTLSGLAAFVVPGPDAYSRAQGVPHARPGGVEARAADGMVEAFDFFLPVPDSFVQALAAGLATGMSEVPMPALDPVMSATEEAAATLDRAFLAFTENDNAVPLSLLVALVLNFVATSVNPDAVSGPFPSAPFANLDYAAKAEVFRRMEEDNAELVALLDGSAPEPMRASLSGEVALLGGLLPAFAALFSYSEYGVFDRERGVAVRRPVGWDLTGYAPRRTAPSDGWDEFKGYYQGRRKAQPARRSARRKQGRTRNA